MQALMVRLFAAITLAAPLLLAHPTAVFTLDVKRPELVVAAQRSLQATFDQWSKRCTSTERDESYTLKCPATAHDWGVLTRPATVALFRDLDEVLYIAGCPIFEDEDEPRDPDNRKSEQEKESTSELERDCLEIEPGHTFSAEVDPKRMEIVFRGKQLPMTVYKVTQPERKLGSPRGAKPSHVPVRHAGPETSTVYEPLKGPEPHWEPPTVAPSAAQRRGSKRSADDPGPAKTSLRTGVVELRCSAGARDVYIDGWFMGKAPLTVPLPAGRHELQAFVKGLKPIQKAFVIEAGDTLQLEACGPTSPERE